MSATFIDKNKLQELKGRLEGANEGLDAGHIKTIRDTSKELFDIFTKPDSVADFSLKDDLKEINDILKKREETLASKDSIKETEITSNYGTLFHPDAKAADIDPKDNNRISLQMKDFYEDPLMGYFKSTFPAFADFRDKMRKDPTYKIDTLEATGKANSKNLNNIHDALKKNDIFISSTNPEIKEKLTRLIILFSQLDYFVESGKKPNQLDQANKIIDKIEITCNQLEAYEKTKKALETISARQKAMEGLEITNPKNIIKATPNKATKTAVTIDLKEHFLDPAKGLNELPEGYEIGKLQLKDADNKPIEIFEDINGKKFEKTLKQGNKEEIFVKDETGGYRKLGSISIATSRPAQLSMEVEAYQDLPRALAFPTKIMMEATGIGGQGKKITDKVSITKSIAAEREKPDFSGEYDKLDTIIKYNEKLEKLYNNLYEEFLQDQLNKFFTNHEDESIRNGRKKLSDEQKRTFFIDIIQTNTYPVRGAGITDIDKVRKQNVLSLAQFQAVFKERILKGFTGKTDMHLKEHILEKLGTEGWTKANPTYAQGLLGEKIMEAYQKNEAKRALRMAINKFLLGIDDQSITQAPDATLYPNLQDIHGAKELTASVADVEAITEEQAKNQANEEFVKSYQASMKRSLKRARLFFFRTHIINNKIKKAMKGTSKKLLTDDETTSAVNRRMLKKELNLAGANKIKVENRIFNDPVFQERINAIVNEYLQKNSSRKKEDFEREIKEMIDNNHELKMYMEKNNITQIGSNLIERVEFEKEQRKYYDEIMAITENYAQGNIKTREDYDQQIRQKIGEFSEKQKRLPDLVKELNLDINARDFSEKLAAHKTVLERMRNRTVTMRVNMLINAKPKVEPKGIKKLLTGVQKDERGLTTAQHVQIDKLGGRGKFYRRIEKHPRRTAIGTSVGLIGAAMIPVVGVGVGAGMLFTLNYLKKRGHYTKEHVKFEKELLAMTPDQREKYIRDMKEDAEKRPERLRKIFPKKYDKYGASMEYLEKTQSVQLLIDNIKRYSGTGKILSTAEMDSLREYTLKGIATLQLQEKEGRNFMYSKTGEENVEKLYNDLYTTILGGLGRLDSTRKPVDSYNAIKNNIGRHTNTILKNTEYKDNKAKMESMRTKLGIFAGSKAAAIYLGTAWLMGQIREGRDNVFGGNESVSAKESIHQIQVDQAIKAEMQNDLGKTIDFNNINPSDQPAIINRFKQHGYSLNDATNEIYKITTIPGGLQLDNAFGTNGNDLLNKVFDGDTAKFEAFKAKISALQSGDRSSTLRGTMKDIYGTNALANEKTHAFFDNFGSSIMENGQHELIKLTSQSPLSNAGAEKIAVKMTERYTGSGMLTGNEMNIVTNPAKIKELFDGFANGTYNLNNLPQGWNVETANNVLHCKYGGFGDGLKDYIFDVGSEKSKETIGKIITENPGSGDVSMGRRRRRFNSFGVPTVRNEVNNFKEQK